MLKPKSPKTIAATNGVGVDRGFGAVTPPLYLSSTFVFDGFEREGPYAYTRSANPTRDLLADTLAKLEGGAGAVVTASGMSAIDLVISQLGPRDLIVAPHDCYSGTSRLLAARAAKGQFGVKFIDQSDPIAVSGAMERRPAMLLIETPSNPLLRIVDIALLAAQAHAEGAKVVVDNTFLSPAVQRPIEFGADFVVHSTTKFLNGHSDVVGGAVIAAAASDVQILAEWANTVGVGGAPFDSYLTLRGLRTLFPRMAQQQRSAEAVAAFLMGHAGVKAVYYPGLSDHPGHVIARRQQGGFGAMVSFEIEGEASGVRAFLEALSVFSLAESLGGVESLIAHPESMTHASMTPKARAAAGIGANLLRLSVGLEGEGDLLDDLDRALKAIAIA